MVCLNLAKEITHFQRARVDPKRTKRPIRIPVGENGNEEPFPTHGRLGRTAWDARQRPQKPTTKPRPIDVLFVSSRRKNVGSAGNERARELIQRTDARSNLENRSSVDFQKSNEHHVAHGGHALSENRPLVDFQLANEHHITHGARLQVDNRSLVDQLAVI